MTRLTDTFRNQISPKASWYHLPGSCVKRTALFLSKLLSNHHEDHLSAAASMVRTRLPRMCPQLPKIAFEGRISTTRPRGRPRRRRKENFSNQPYPVLLRTAKNREAYRKCFHDTIRVDAPSQPTQPDGSQESK